MKRKEVVVAGKVFNLGLKEFDEAVTEEAKRGLNLELDIGPTVFQMGVSRSDKAVILHWVGETNISNIIWQRFVFLKPRWPPVRTVSCYSFRKEVESVSY